MYYDYVEDHPAGWDEVKPVWFDVAQCGTSEVGGGQAGGNFKIASGVWTASFDGEVTAVGGYVSVSPLFVLSIVYSHTI